ncbi:uncharacterized protein [Leptinotarsa decemlineata]|uniref:uncharacterized protein n=1 Tax=Leptinotarsa decemlineata TaxID=7539 RepID=UPI003D3097A1
MRNPTRVCIQLFRRGATCGKPLVMVSADNTKFHARKISKHTYNKYKKVTRGCLPWETESNREFQERQKCKHMNHDELKLIKKEYPMLHAVRKKYIPGCPAPGWQELNTQHKKKANHCY